jgi:hypothetical protein
LKASIVRLLEAQPLAMHLTHYGRVERPQRLAHALIEQIDAMVAIAQSVATEAQRHARLREALTRDYMRRIRAHGCALDEAAVIEVVAMDVELNAQGLGIWLDRAGR